MHPYISYDVHCFHTGQIGSLMRTFAGYSVSSNDLKSILLYLTVSKDAGTWVSFYMNNIYKSVIFTC